MISHGSLLVVDDNDDNRDVLSRRLRQRGYTVEVAADGEAALALIARQTFDLVLLDVEMPNMSGLDVLQRVRAVHAHTALPVIMVTARSQGPDVVEAFRLGANDYVTKPIDFPVALARIATHLEHKHAVERLRESEQRYELAMQGAKDGLWDWNLTTNQVFWSGRWKEMLGYHEAEIDNSPDEWFSRVHPDDLCRVKEALDAHLAADSGHYECEHRVLHRDGQYRWVLCRGAAVRTAGVATRLAGSLTDITEARVADPLTGLPNRLLFEELLERAIKRSDRRGEYLFALLVLGLDRFKTVNESFGRPAADRLLVAVARRLNASLRSTDAISRAEDRFTLARLAGDEFTVLLDDISDASDAMRVSERLREALEKPFEVEGQIVFATASVGIAVSSTGYTGPDEILRDATIALHRAKTDGGGSKCELFDAGMRQRAVGRLQIETELRGAIENAGFEVYYQPIISIETGEIAAFEALVRWRHESRGLLAPAEFIGVAEDTGMILQIGRLVLAESCRQMAIWRNRFGSAAPALMCVNVSSRQFADANFADHLERVLRRARLPASCLKLEITESAFLRDLPAAQITLARVHALGVRWSLDDFGTGYSSLSYLHMLPVATLKVDRTFVSGITAAGKGTEMVRAIVTLSHNLGMDVVAEGVETPEQLSALRRLGCEYAQGFYFSKPADSETAGHLIGAQPWKARGNAVCSVASHGDDARSNALRTEAGR